MTLKGAAANQACAACKYQRKRCTPECALAPHFRPEHPLVFRNAHKLFGVRNILRILEQINPDHKAEAMRSIIYEANMRDQFPVYGCLNVICDLQYQIRKAEEELHSILTWLAFYKQHYEQQQMITILPSGVSHGMLQPGTTTTLQISSRNNANAYVNAFWLQETYKSSNSDYNSMVSRPCIIEEETVHRHGEIYSCFHNTRG